jgi:NADH-quinone oxidoreductase subunit G
MIDTRDNTVVRLRPRPNLEVNRHFMCDTGRMNYRWLNRGDRIEAPLVLDGSRHSASDWDVALSRLSALVRKGGRTVILASGGASLESLGLVKKLLGETTLTAVVQIPMADREEPLQGIPGLALRRERAANGDGARLLGYSTDWTAGVKAAAAADLVVVLDTVLTDAEAALVSAAGAVVVLGTLQAQELPAAVLVLPVTNMAEENGTFVNRDLRVQRYQQARSAPGMARPAWWIAAAAGAMNVATAAAAFALAAGLSPALAGMTYADLGLTGRVANAAVPASAGA